MSKPICTPLPCEAGYNAQDIPEQQQECLGSGGDGVSVPVGPLRNVWHILHEAASAAGWCRSGSAMGKEGTQARLGWQSGCAVISLGSGWKNEPWGDAMPSGNWEASLSAWTSTDGKNGGSGEERDKVSAMTEGELSQMQRSKQHGRTHFTYGLRERRRDEKEAAIHKISIHMRTRLGTEADLRSAYRLWEI